MKLPIPQALEYGRRVLLAQGAPDDIARVVAEHLVESDRVGYTSHGLSILSSYRRTLQSGQVRADGRPERVNDRGAMLAYDGHMGLGQYVGKVVIEDAIARTREHGQCIVTLRNSHHLGRMGHYGELVAAQGLILLAFTNVTNRPPTVAPFGGARACLTTNPLCFAGPLPGGRPPFIVDMATSSIAVNKARVLAARNEPAPAGSLIDARGNPTTDPQALFTDPPGALLPFGGHKGYALGLVAELLAGVLSGGGTIQPEHPRSGVVTNNLFAIVLDPQVDFNADWRTHEVAAFVDYLQACPPQPGVDRVQYPGEYEARNRELNADALDFDAPIYEGMKRLAAELGVPDALP
ncbi:MULTISPECIES: Ldh family oxidoreductase [unclassified Achromobacter]|uniref:Ldh family oxidoreductase n=1 Tax=unclassified Achromobacter TaxID=2626865 RepID=UPI00069D84D4|nr:MULTISPECIES: Ldh family oxidoreductase [unclassified Achromobacter]KOF53789.1 lactate dehydrogenase [Achromobacter sp. DMS1]